MPVYTRVQQTRKRGTRIGKVLRGSHESTKWAVVGSSCMLYGNMGFRLKLGLKDEEYFFAGISLHRGSTMLSETDFQDSR
ncbi:hypothetical protein M407DRAFT_159501 [Tulasnella calospora MUT 4182]|uniref:Uncharacterized protein n=1 Tax=Tulasnella calospora MUT 4182 TaxID=1051891 RepID=A0A0C3QF72_9AGAM|nr:hypothetical protein M407DRAFT_159501 [Tulasnella calospora MUT 4182]